MHRADLARLEAEAHYDRERLTPVVAPGSTAEAHALALIDQARDEELGRGESTFASRRASSARYWRRHAAS
jgi:hypothetical protein